MQKNPENKPWGPFSGQGFCLLSLLSTVVGIPFYKGTLLLKFIKCHFASLLVLPNTAHLQQTSAAQPVGDHHVGEELSLLPAKTVSSFFCYHFFLAPCACSQAMVSDIRISPGSCAIQGLVCRPSCFLEFPPYCTLVA